MSYSISSEPRLAEPALQVPVSLSRLPSFMAAAARRATDQAASSGQDAGASAGTDQAASSGQDGVSTSISEAARFALAGDREAAAARAQEEAYLSMGRAARRAPGLEGEPLAGEDALPGAALTTSAAERPGAEAPRLLPGENDSGRRPGQFPDTGGDRQVRGLPAFGADEARSPERSFMGGQAPLADSGRERGAGEDQGAGGTAHGGHPDAATGGGEAATGKGEVATGGGGSGSAKGEASAGGQTLSREEKAQVEEMKKRDREVRTHEQAHIAAGGDLVSGGASYETQTGPDGKAYAVGGEVQIDTSEGSTPEATISKAQRIRSAALAPAEPSGQDRAVAAQASQMEAAARTEKREQSQEERAEGLAGQSGEEEDGNLTGAKNPAGQGPAPVEGREADVPKAGSIGSGRLSHAAAAYERASGLHAPALHGFTRSFAV